MLSGNTVPSIIAVVCFYLLTVGLTIAIEAPVLIRGKVTKNRRLISGVNIVTNVLLNLSLTLLYLLEYSGAGKASADTLAALWFLLAELLLIPLSEAFVYRKASAAGTKRIIVFTYLANLASCAAGIVLTILLRNLQS